MEVSLTPYLPWKPTALVPVGDVQLGASGIDLSRLRDDIKRGLDNEAWFVGLGDYLDVASPSGRQKIRSADFYDSITEALEHRNQEHIEEFCELMAGTEGRWLGFLQGHHYYEFGDGSTSDTRIADRLKGQFLGDSALIRMRWKRGTGPSHAIDIYATHGSGSGQTQAAPLNKLERFAGGVRADIYLINHYARRGAIPADVLYLNNANVIESRTVYYIATGGYMAAYEQGSRKAGRAQGSYVEKAMMKPTAMGGTIIKLKPWRTQAQGPDRHGVEIEVTV